MLQTINQNYRNDRHLIISNFFSKKKFNRFRSINKTRLGNDKTIPNFLATDNSKVKIGTLTHFHPAMSPSYSVRWQLDVEQLGRVNGWKLSSAARRGISGVRVPRAPSLADAVLLPRTQHCCAFATPSRYTDLSWWNPHHARRTACRTRWCALPTNDLDRHW